MGLDVLGNTPGLRPFVYARLDPRPGLKLSGALGVGGSMRNHLPFGLLLALMLAACGGSPAAEDRTITLDQSQETSDSVSPAPTSGGGEDLNVGSDTCTTDADCVPATCCHATACVAQANAPSCGDAMCTLDCRSGTVDCGGGCLCHEGHCAAHLSGQQVLVDVPVAE